MRWRPALSTSLITRFHQLQVMRSLATLHSFRWGRCLKRSGSNSKTVSSSFLVDRVEALDDFVHNYSTELDCSPSIWR